MNNNRRTFVLMLIFASLAPLFGETIAVTVRNQSESERAPGLAELVEQGAMEYLFASGTIVFDLDLDPEDDVYAYRAIDEAALGGASFVLVIDLTFTTLGERELYPAEVSIVVLDVDDEHELVRATILADDLQGETDLTSETMANLLGTRASAVALEEIMGGSAAW